MTFGVSAAPQCCASERARERTEFVVHSKLDDDIVYLEKEATKKLYQFTWCMFFPCLLFVFREEQFILLSPSMRFQWQMAQCRTG